MFSKKFTKRLIGIFLSLSIASGVIAHFGSKYAWAVPAQQSRYVEGDKRFNLTLPKYEIPAAPKHDDLYFMVIVNMMRMKYFL